MLLASLVALTSRNIRRAPPLTEVRATIDEMSVETL
jgi:hypothetical protein